MQPLRQRRVRWFKHLRDRLCRGSSELLSALGRRHLAADLAAWVGLGVNIDIPFARRHLLCLFGRERGLTFDGVANGGALLLSQITGGAFLPCVAGPWKCAMVAGPERPLWFTSHVRPRGGVVSQISRAGGAGSHRRHLLRAV